MKYVGEDSTHKPSTLRIIPSGILNRLAKITSRKPFISSEVVNKIYPNHANYLRKAGLAHSNFLIMGDLRSKKDEKVDIEKEPEINKKKNRNVYFYVAYSHYFSKYIQRVINKHKIF